MCQKKHLEDKHVDILLIGGRGKNVLIKDFNIHV